MTTATAPADRERVVGLLEALGATGDATILTLPGQPPSKPRHRSGQGQAYASAAQKASEAYVGAALQLAYRRPLTGNLALVAIFYRSSRGVVDRDNLDKLVCDAGNKKAWGDDCQVTAGAQLVELDRENPRTVLGIAPCKSSLQR
jgi:Holliday junction resolvase RusA-like endonuclease